MSDELWQFLRQLSYGAVLGLVAICAPTLLMVNRAVLFVKGEITRYRKEIEERFERYRAEDEARFRQFADAVKPRETHGRVDSLERGLAEHVRAASESHGQCMGGIGEIKGRVESLREEMRTSFDRARSLIEDLRLAVKTKETEHDERLRVLDRDVGRLQGHVER